MNLKTIRLWLGSPEDILQEKIDIMQRKIDALIQPITQPVSIGFISYQEVSNILQVLTKSFYISDNNFDVCSVDDARIFSAQSKVWADKWVSEHHDCDNFSFALNGYWSEGLKSFAFGIAWSKGHAFNIFIDDKKKVWIVEPQTNEYIDLEKAKLNSNYWPIRVVMM